MGYDSRKAGIDACPGMGIEPVESFVGGCPKLSLGVESEVTKTGFRVADSPIGDQTWLGACCGGIQGIEPCIRRDPKMAVRAHQEAVYLRDLPCAAGEGVRIDTEQGTVG